MSNYSNNFSSLFVCTNNINYSLALNIAKCLNINLGNVSVDKFPDNEINVKYNENISGKDVFIIQSFSFDINTSIMELILMIDAAKRASADRITVIMPYHAYARQDRLDSYGVSISSKVIANMITHAGADRIVTLDLHSQQITGFYDIPIYNIRIANIILPKLKEIFNIDNLNNLVFVSPDIGGMRNLNIFKDQLDVDIAIIHKERNNSKNVESLCIIGDVKNRICILVDDIVSTAGTMIAAEKIIFENGASKLFAIVSHCLLNNIGIERLKKSRIEKLIVTDSMQCSYIQQCENDLYNLQTFSIANTLSDVILNIHNNNYSYIKAICR